MLHTISSKELKVQFDDSLGEVSVIEFENITALKPPAYGSWAKSWPVMFPICGKLKDGKYTHKGKTYELPGHGFFRSLKWSVAVADVGSSIHATATNTDAFTAVYPFKFAISLKISIHGNVFSYAVKVENKGDEAMFFNSGHHGAFMVDPQHYAVELTKPATFVKYMAAGGTGPSLGPVSLIKHDTLDLDSDCSYQTVNSGIHAAVLRSGKGYVAHMAFQDFDVLTLWARPHSDWLCIEPWNGNQDVGNASIYELAKKPLIKALAPKQHHEDVLTITFERE